MYERILLGSGRVFEGRRISDIDANTEGMAEIVSVSAPTMFTPGVSFPIGVVIKNIGTYADMLFVKITNVDTGAVLGEQSIYVNAGTTAPSLSFILNLSQTTDFHGRVESGHVEPQLEDFTTYTKFDPPSDMVVTSHKVAVTTMRRDANSYVYKDYGAGRFSGDFEHIGKFTLRDYDNSTDGALCAIWTLSNCIGALNTCGGFGGAGIHELTCFLYVWSAGSKVGMYLRKWDGGVLIDSDNTPSPQVYDINDVRWWRVKRVGKVVTMSLYTDEARTVLDIELVITENVAHDYNIIYAAQGDLSAYHPAQWISCDIEDLYL